MQALVALVKTVLMAFARVLIASRSGAWGQIVQMVYARV